MSPQTKKEAINAHSLEQELQYEGPWWANWFMSDEIFRFDEYIKLACMCRVDLLPPRPLIVHL